jgi:hypothetical protein
LSYSLISMHPTFFPHYLPMLLFLPSYHFLSSLSLRYILNVLSYMLSRCLNYRFNVPRLFLVQKHNFCLLNFSSNLYLSSTSFSISTILSLSLLISFISSLFPIIYSFHCLSSNSRQFPSYLFLSISF